MSRSSNASHPSLASRKLPILSREQEKIRWFEKNKTKLLQGAGIFFVVIVCSLLIIAYQRTQNFHARENLRLGIAEFQAGRLEKAIPLLEKARDLLGSGDEAQVAEIYLIETYTRQGQFDRTKELDVPHESVSEDNYLTQITLLTLGRNAEGQKDQASARKFYEEAAAIADGPLGADALLSLARVAEFTGDAVAAKDAREKFLATYPNSPLADIVRQKVNQ